MEIEEIMSHDRRRWKRKESMSKREEGNGTCEKML
jgi:hypothetical protein